MAEEMNDFELQQPPEQFVELLPEERDELIEQAKDLKELFDEFEEEFNRPHNDFMYILSAKWLRTWKRYVSYDLVTKGQEPDEYFGQIKPGYMNEDLVIEETSHCVTFPDSNDYRNIFLKDGIQAEKDYILVHDRLWDKLKFYYNGITIKRPVITLPSGLRRVEVRLKQFNVVFMTNSIFRDIDHKRIPRLNSYRIQSFTQTTLKEFRDHLSYLLNSSHAYTYLKSPLQHGTIGMIDADQIRLWKLDTVENLEKMFTHIQDICNKTSSYDYKIPFKGEFVEKDEGKSLDEANIADSDYVFLEIREGSKNWNFTGPGVPSIEKCEYCSNYGVLKYPCACKKVAYCSQDCKMKDKKFHESRCDKPEDDEDEEDSMLIRTGASKMGRVGLQNLGNTCFMNGGLQCLSNFKELNDYFLSEIYKQEINENNPLGTKGKLTKRFANLLKNLWYGTSPFSRLGFQAWSCSIPSDGYQQHDSQEFLNFLLDGLHEDLNRVLVKPFVETLESNNQPDYQVGMLSWQNHLKRNRSIIVDLLHGQYKSKLTCPECTKVSITFDPYMSVSVPIPVNKQKEIEFFFMHADLHNKPYKINLKFPKENHYVTDLKETVAKLLEKDPKSFYFTFLTHMTKEIVTDEATTTTNTLRKKKKLKGLFAVELTKEEMEMDPQDYINVDISFTKKSHNYFGSILHKPFTFVRTLRLKKNYTLRQIYLRLFKQVRFLFDEFYPGKFEDNAEELNENFKKMSDEEAFKFIYENAAKKPFKILFVTNTRGYYQCYFCGNTRCENCEIPLDDTKTLEADVLSKINDPNFDFEIEFYWENLPDYIDIGRCNTCVDYHRVVKGEESKTDDANSEKPRDFDGVTIEECLKSFEEPEQLAPENEWYCSECKKHQRAFKKMEIYKAPPVLILHLKRFKATSSILSRGKIEEKVLFPVGGEVLDMSSFVKNHELPMDYPLLDTQSKPEEQKMEIETSKQDGNLEESKNGPALGDMEEEKAQNHHDDSNSNHLAPEKSQDKLLYELFGVVNHYGSLGFGHYTAFAKNWADERWYSFDDSTVAPVDTDQVCSTASYVLFYRRKNWKFNLPPKLNPPAPNQQQQQQTQHQEGQIIEDQTMNGSTMDVLASSDNHMVEEQEIEL